MQSNRLLQFFWSKGIKAYGATYTLDGKNLSPAHSEGLIAMNGVAALVATDEHRNDFVEELWNIKTPSGTYRYYDGILYLLGLLEAGGHYRIYQP
jgi:oligosaccharide reducing-end xylanase